MTEQPIPPDRTSAAPADAGAHYGALLRHTLLRSFFLYFVPLCLISLFFLYQHHRTIAERERIHLTAVAENRASTLDLFLRERWVNLLNVIDDPRFVLDPDTDRLRSALQSLQRTSPAFVDLGLLDSRGRLLVYEGPYPSLQSQNYEEEAWFRQLASGEEPYIVTDNYLGFRGELHFTIAVRRDIEARPYVVRAALSPDRLYQEIASPKAKDDFRTFVVNAGGYYQLVSPGQGKPLALSPFRPPREPSVGVVGPGDVRGAPMRAYAWLETAPWILVTQSDRRGPIFADPVFLTGIAFTVVVLVIGAVVLLIRAHFLVRFQVQARETEAALSGQLVQAAKLASVGELAAGIAHEINNPLAIIAEEVGLMKDLSDPRFGRELTREEIERRLDTVHTAVFRCRDITRKLLTFVRQTEVKFAPHDINEIVDEVVEGLLGRELSVSNIELERRYCKNPPLLVTDGSQLLQVFMNLVRNAIDAMGNEGRLTVKTEVRDGKISVSVKDTGCGMTADQLERIFKPFYTTKEPGRGTGLGLSVSHSIIKSLGGEIYVESAPGKGSCFRVDLPLESERR